MIKLRIEFLDEKERLALLKTLEEHYEIVETGNIKDSHIPGNKFKLQFLSMISKDK